MHVYRHFIRENIAPVGTKHIGVYNKNNEKIAEIPLGRMSPPTTEPLYSFGLVSDIHLYPIAAVEWTPEEKFDNALTFFERNDCVFCAHCGDITQTGLYLEGDAVNMDTRQFAKYKEICDRHPYLPVYGICGNHECYMNPITKDLDKLKEYTGTDLYYTVAQGDDLFVFIGQPSGSIVMGEDAFSWLSDILSANQYKRYFIVVHAYIEEDSGDPLDVRENSIFDSWGTTNTTAFMNLLRQYKNTILFHGHSHMKFENQEHDVNANYTEKNGFKSVHVPSLGVPRDINFDTMESKDDRSASQAYIVDVYEDCIVLNAWDMIDVQYIPLGIYKIDT